MRKRIIFYGLAFGITILVFLSFNRQYQELLRYAELTHRANTEYSCFQALSKQIQSAAVLNPDLMESSSPRIKALFSADSQSIYRQLDVLRFTVKDSVNTKISNELDARIKSELPWIISSNVPDSILHHRSPGHVAAFAAIDSLISLGLVRTAGLLDARRKKLDDTNSVLKTWIV
ncbi:MAG: hypothetical protein ABUL44_02385, partial [Flavobacterium sp.]